MSNHFQIFTEEEIASLRRGGHILHDCLVEVSRLVAPGVETRVLDVVTEEFIRDHGAIPAFKGYKGFPASLCTSVNEECVHGIPGDRALREGDIVSLDCGVLFEGLYTDACVTVPVGEVSKEAHELLSVTARALKEAVAILHAGMHVGDLSHCIQTIVEDAGFRPVRVLTGHGVGSFLHQFPDIPNLGGAGEGPVIPPYTVLAIEPIISAGSAEVREGSDGWTLRIEDGGLSCHFEHTVVVLPGGSDVLT